MSLSDTQIFIALVVALFPAVIAVMLGSALADS
jgi:photosystem I reaction center subunit XII